ncbi:DNA translocase FtsK 4TM domain-containing protein [Patescibacteria group bacterium]|nr:DNA translocase FtsK 4TM domain-containing protein [Patescibacteria group bacterium]
MSRSSSPSFWSSLSLNERTQRGLFSIALFFLAVLMVLGLFQAAGWLGASLMYGLGYLFGWERIFFPLIFSVWGYHVFRPERELLQPRTVIGMVLWFFATNPFVHLVTFEAGQAVPDTALLEAGGKIGQWIGDPLTQFVGFAGAIAFLVALFIASLMLLFHVGLEDVLAFLAYVKRFSLWLWEAVSQPVRAWMDRRVMVEQASSSVFTPAQAFEAPQDQDDAQGEDEEGLEEEELEEGEESEEDEEALSNEEMLEEEGEDGEEEEEVAPRPSRKKKKQYPHVEMPLSVFEVRDQKANIGNPKQYEELIRKTLSAFGIPVESAGYAAGPTVTQYMVKPAEGIKVSRIVGLQNDLALALSAQTLRIEAPIPGKPYVGVEVPNQSSATVGMREILESKEYREKKHSLMFVLGKDVSGKTALADLSRMPHALVAGATGSGKSVCLNVMIASLLYSNRPDELRLIMVDPKRVEMQMYNGIPHLLTPVITDIPEAVNALKWAVREMTRRYGLLPQVNAKNIGDYNARVPQEEKMPVICFVIDELADLMMTAKNEIEGPIVRLCQMSRAVGIHLVLATQRPSVDVITGLIKANVPTRIAFAVASAVDSKTILDQVGADKLLGRGDMLFSSSELPQPRRIQGAFVSDQEIGRVVEFIKTAYGGVDYDLSVTERSEGSGTSFSGGADADSDQDPLLSEAWNEVQRAGRASASLLQRRLKVGYSRAARILDEMEQAGWIGPENGSKGRELLRKTGAGEQLELPVADEPPPKISGNERFYDL